jgi:hypothetical protein
MLQNDSGMKKENLQKGVGFLEVDIEFIAIYYASIS